MMKPLSMSAAVSVSDKLSSQYIAQLPAQENVGMLGIIDFFASYLKVLTKPYS